MTTTAPRFAYEPGLAKPSPGPAGFIWATRAKFLWSASGCHQSCLGTTYFENNLAIDQRSV